MVVLLRLEVCFRVEMGSFFYSFEIINNIVPCLLCCIVNFVLGRNRCFFFYHSFGILNHIVPCLLSLLYSEFYSSKIGNDVAREFLQNLFAIL
jgi:hypothetical protein